MDHLLTTFSVPPTLLADLALASRILAHHAVLSTFGHISVRHTYHPPTSPTPIAAFLLPTATAPALVRASDIAIYSVATGERLDPHDARHPALERHIHAGIYRARPDLHAVLHCHAPILVAFSVLPPRAPYAESAAPAPRSVLGPVLHVAASTGLYVPVYDVAHSFGDATDLLIRTAEMGDDLAAAFGEEVGMVLMRGHGATVVSAAGVRDLVHRGIYAVVNAGVVKDALGIMGGKEIRSVIGLTEGEVKACNEGEVNAVARSWPAWVAEVGGEGMVWRDG